jgi:hypothetical protein
MPGLLAFVCRFDGDLLKKDPSASIEAGHRLTRYLAHEVVFMFRRWATLLSGGPNEFGADFVALASGAHGDLLVGELLSL